MDLERLHAIAGALKSMTDLPLVDDTKCFTMEFGYFVQPKERPRGTANGRHYTPAATRKFEDALRRIAYDRMRELKMNMFLEPVAIQLEIWDKVPSDLPPWLHRLAMAGYVFEITGGDLDNKEKAILDAMNKIVYKDDIQVVQVMKTRRYREHAGFKLTVVPVGLTKSDLMNIAKLLGEAVHGTPKKFFPY